MAQKGNPKQVARDAFVAKKLAKMSLRRMKIASS